MRIWHLASFICRYPLFDHECQPSVHDLRIGRYAHAHARTWGSGLGRETGVQRYIRFAEASTLAAALRIASDAERGFIDDAVMVPSSVLQLQFDALGPVVLTFAEF